MPQRRRPVNSSWKAQPNADDLARVSTENLWDMLDANLQRLTAAWEGNMTVVEREGRARLCAAISKEIRSRGLQLRLQF